MGISGSASLTSGDNFYVADVHLGYNGAKGGLAKYKRVLSRRTIARYRIGRTRRKLVHTRYCRERQGTARHHQLTIGPRFVFTAQGKGMGGHLTYRFLKLYTRSNMLFHLDAHAAYARLNLFDGIGEGGGEQVTNAYGGGIKAGYAWGIFSSTVSLEYFAKAWLLNLTVGLTFWGA